MKIKGVNHIALAVEGIEAFAEMMAETFGMRASLEQEFPEHHSKLALFNIHNTNIELIEGTDQAAGVRKWIKAKGQSVYHICFEVENINEALAELKSKNVKLLNEEPMEGHARSQIVFLDPVGTGGILFELAEFPHGHAH